MRLEGQAAIVTGAAQGLGEALARRLAVEGCDVLLADVNGAQAEEAAKKIAQDTGRRAVGRAVDVTSEEQVAGMANAATEAFGKLDILVANAGVLRAGDITTLSPAD